jgi:hypothetical protein
MHRLPFDPVIRYLDRLTADFVYNEVFRDHVCLGRGA